MSEFVCVVYMWCLCVSGLHVCHVTCYTVLCLPGVSCDMFCCLSGSGAGAHP